MTLFKSFKTAFIAITATLFIVLAAGCGQSGPLYLPGNPSQIKTNTPEAEEERRREEKEDDNSQKTS